MSAPNHVTHLINRIGADTGVCPYRGNEMTFDPQKHHRRSIRLPEYDHAQAGAYFVTLCAQDRLNLFGDIRDGEVLLNDAGVMVSAVWSEIPEHYPGVMLDYFVLMPNHLHGIIVLTGVGAGPSVCPDYHATQGQTRGSAPTGISLGEVVQRFKTLTTNRYISGVRTYGWPSFLGRLWQRNYYEHIIRNEGDLTEIREYMALNPSKWAEDHEYWP